MLIEAAWIAVRYDQHLREQFERLAYRIGREKAIVAIAARAALSLSKGAGRHLVTA